MLRNGTNSIANMSSRWWWKRWVLQNLAITYECGKFNTIHLFVQVRRENINSFLKHIRIRSNRLTKFVPETKWERITGPDIYQEMDAIINEQIDKDMSSGDVPQNLKLYPFGSIKYNNKKIKPKKK
jgi:hypothetical protein